MLPQGRQLKWRAASYLLDFSLYLNKMEPETSLIFLLLIVLVLLFPIL